LQNEKLTVNQPLLKVYKSKLYKKGQKCFEVRPN